MTAESNVSIRVLGINVEILGHGYSNVMGQGMENEIHDKATCGDRDER